MSRAKRENIRNFTFFAHGEYLETAVRRFPAIITTCLMRSIKDDYIIYAKSKELGCIYIAEPAVNKHSPKKITLTLKNNAYEKNFLVIYL